MTSRVLPSRKRTAFCAAIGCVAVIAAALSAGLSRAQAEEEMAAPETVAAASKVAVATGNPFADRFPNVVLKTHEGKNVRFYEDLLKGKIVLINFFYVTCDER